MEREKNFLNEACFTSAVIAPSISDRLALRRESVVYAHRLKAPNCFNFMPRQKHD